MAFLRLKKNTQAGPVLPQEARVGPVLSLQGLCSNHQRFGVTILVREEGKMGIMSGPCSNDHDRLHGLCADTCISGTPADAYHPPLPN